MIVIIGNAGGTLEGKEEEVVLVVVEATSLAATERVDVVVALGPWQ